MTYMKKLEDLLAATVEKSANAIEVVKEYGTLRDEHVRNAHTEWENAENDYCALLTLIKDNQINIKDNIPE